MSRWQKTKIDVFATLFNIDKIPEPIISGKNLCRRIAQEADDVVASGINGIGYNAMPVLTVLMIHGFVVMARTGGLYPERVSIPRGSVRNNTYHRKRVPGTGNDPRTVRKYRQDGSGPKNSRATGPDPAVTDTGAGPAFRESLKKEQPAVRNGQIRQFFTTPQSREIIPKNTLVISGK
jgi:hypothetical protein